MKRNIFYLKLKLMHKKGREAKTSGLLPTLKPLGVNSLFFAALLLYTVHWVYSLGSLSTF